MKSILKIIIHVLKLLQKIFECFTSNPNAHGTVWNLHIKMSSAHSPSVQALHLRHSSFWFSKLSVTSPTPQLIIQPFTRFTYVTTHSPTLPLLHLRHSSFSNPSFASPTSQDFHLSHLASRPCSLQPLHKLVKSILILSSHLCLGLPKSLWLSDSPTKTLYAFLDCSICATCPAHLSRLH